MITLIVVGICLWAFGWLRALTIYVALIASGVSLVLIEVCALSFSYLFWNETVRQFSGSEYWVSMFISRPGFHPVEAPLIPVIFFFDLVKKGFEFCWQVPNIFSIGLFGYWWYMMYQIWFGVAGPLIYNVGNNPGTTRR